MKFLVRRASKWFDEDVLVDEAESKTIVCNGREVNTYYVEINTLEELMNFHNKYGRIVIGHSVFDEESMQILIYDDYIE